MLLERSLQCSLYTSEGRTTPTAIFVFHQNGYDVREFVRLALMAEDTTSVKVTTDAIVTEHHRDDGSLVGPEWLEFKADTFIGSPLHKALEALPPDARAHAARQILKS